MRKAIKITLSTLTVAVMALFGVKYGDEIIAFVTGNTPVSWYSTTLSETLKEANELVVYSIETEGNEVMTNQVALIGSTQKLSIPYKFHMEFKVDLSLASIKVNGTTIEVRVPSPYGANPALTVDESKVKKYDFFDPISNQQYAEYKQQIQDKLFEKYCSSQVCQNSAWEAAQRNIKSLLEPVLNGNTTFTLSVIRDDSLAGAAKAQ